MLNTRNKINHMKQAHRKKNELKTARQINPIQMLMYYFCLVSCNTETIINLWQWKKNSFSIVIKSKEGNKINKRNDGMNLFDQPFFLEKHMLVIIIINRVYSKHDF